MKSIKSIKRDLNLFLDVQTAKYLQSANKEKFSSDAEAQSVTEQIADVFEKRVAPDYLRLNNLNKEAKIDWFNSIEINFDEEIDRVNELIENFDPTDFDLDIISEHYDKIFYFLPPASWQVLILASPAFEAVGFPLNRFKEIFSGEPLTKIEIDLFSWAYELTLCIIEAINEKSKKRMTEAIEDALAVGLEFLSEEETEEVIKKISDLFIKLAKGKISDKTKKKKK